MFITLTNKLTNKIHNINYMQIIDFFPVDTGSTRLYLSDSRSYLFNETPEQISNLIKRCSCGVHITNLPLKLPFSIG